MKKILLILMAISLLANISSLQNSNAQEIEDNRELLQIGLKLGANASNVYDEKGESFTADLKLGFVGGVFVAIPIGKYLGIQPEVLFSHKGFRASGTVPILGTDYKYAHTANYIDIPILVQLKATKIFTLLAGPQYSYLIKENDRFSDGNSGVVLNYDNVRKNMLGFLGGFDISTNHLVLGARVGWDIQHNNGDGTVTNPRYKNVWYQVTLGYKLY